MFFYYFYILRSRTNKKLYLGFTSDLKERVKHHNSGKDKATKPYAPYDLIYYSAFRNKEDAIACERYFKTTSGWKRMRKMLAKDLLQNRVFKAKAKSY